MTGNERRKPLSNLARKLTLRRIVPTATAQVLALDEEIKRLQDDDRRVRNGNR